MKRLERHPSLVAADAVLAHLEHLIESRPKDLIDWMEEHDVIAYVSSYQNCREHGYNIVISTITEVVHITFAEYRTSDAIVVYVGPMVFRAVSDEAYDRRTTFTDVTLAAEYILDTMVAKTKEFIGNE